MQDSDDEEIPELVDSSDDELDVSSHNSIFGYAMVMHQTKTKNDHVFILCHTGKGGVPKT